MTITKTGEPRVFTTFQVARICGVFHTSVINWVNKGKLKAHLTPGGHRRIKLPDLLEFMHKFEMPIPADLESKRKQVLIVEDDASVTRLLVRSIQSLSDLEVRTCAGGLEALIAIGKDAPDLLVLDIRIPQVDGLEVVRVLRANDQTRPIKILAISGEVLSDVERAFVREHCDAFFAKPVSTAEFRKRVAALVELEGTTAG
jgi:excisionase family DNA binding protein